MKKNYDGLIWGLAFIFAGILFALNIAGVIEFNIWASIWPLIFVIVGLSILNDNFKNIFGYLLILIGILIFFKRQLSLDFDAKYIIAGIMVAIGIMIIYNIYIQKKIPFENGSSVPLRQFVAFAGRSDRINGTGFKGTNTFCLFGGHEIDLRDYVFHENIIINATAVFGGIEILLPANVNIFVRSTPIFGGVENKCENLNNNPYTVYINASALFGGVEIKNRK